jgi:hypothetical protein
MLVEIAAPGFETSTDHVFRNMVTALSDALSDPRHSGRR